MCWAVQRTTHFQRFSRFATNFTHFSCVALLGSRVRFAHAGAVRERDTIHIHDNTSKKTFSGGCLGSRNDEERSEMRYVMRIAESSESSRL